MASLLLFCLSLFLCSALVQRLQAYSNAMAPHNIEAPAAHENSPLLGRDGKKCGPHKSSNSSRSTSSISISSDIESATTADSVIYDVESQTLAKDPPPQQKIATMLCLLLIGTFISAADQSLVTATYPLISSTFSALSSGSWIITSYTLSTCAFQPVLGKLTDIYGRKPVLLLCYIIFMLGIVACGLARDFAQICVARAVSGLGGAGISVVVAILITDLVPMKNVAAWRSYANVVSTTGRAVGGPLGGWLADVVGWRWGFIGQGPIILLTIVVVALYLKVLPVEERDWDLPADAQNKTISKLKRVDFAGAALITSSIVLLILSVDLPNHGLSWTSPTLLACLASSSVLFTIFLLYESVYPLEPIYPPALLKQTNVWTAYVCIALAYAAHLSMFYSVPLYFQITSGASNTMAGVHLVPPIIANSIGGLWAGWYIKKTSRYKNITILGFLFSCCTFVMIIAWWHEDGRGFWKAMATVPAGFGLGIVEGGVFIGLTSDLKRRDMAAGTSGLYLTGNIGLVFGVSVASSIANGGLKSVMEKTLTGEEGMRIVAGVLKDFNFVDTLSEGVRKVVIHAYVKGLARSHILSLVLSILGLIVAWRIPEKRLYV